MASKRSLSLIVSVAALAFLFTTTEAFAQATPGIILTPDKTSVKAGENLTVKMEIETGPGNATNSFQASLNYPKEKLQFESVKTEGSPFSMELEAKGGDGKVRVIRGSFKKLEGKLFAATVNFKALQNTDAGAVSVNNNDSAIVRSSDNKNILPGSTLQNQSSGSQTPSGTATSAPAKSDWVNSIFGRIKAFFSSFFK